MGGGIEPDEVVFKTEDPVGRELEFDTGADRPATVPAGRGCSVVGKSGSGKVRRGRFNAARGVSAFGVEQPVVPAGPSQASRDGPDVGDLRTDADKFAWKNEAWSRCAGRVQIRGRKCSFDAQHPNGAHLPIVSDLAAAKDGRIANAGARTGNPEVIANRPGEIGIAPGTADVPADVEPLPVRAGDTNRSLIDRTLGGHVRGHGGLTEPDGQAGGRKKRKSGRTHWTNSPS